MAGFSRTRISSPGRHKKFDDKPRRGDRPRRDNRGSKGRGGFNLTQAVCASCGEDCEVPFKPTGDKPVLCRNCFKKDGSKSSNVDLSEINQKLDKIMKALKID